MIQGDATAYDLAVTLCRQLRELSGTVVTNAGLIIAEETRQATFTVLQNEDEIVHEFKVDIWMVK